MTKLGAALREKYRTPKDALRALGLDENLISDTNEGAVTMSNEALARKIHAIANRAATVGAMVAYLRPRLALDAKVDLHKVFGDVTGKNFGEKKPAMAERIVAQAKGKLAKDANLDDVGKVLDMLEKHEIDEGADESVSEPQHKAMEAAAHGASNLGIPESVGKEFAAKDAKEEGLRAMLKEKGMTDDDVDGVCDMMFKKTAADESPEEKAKREAKEKADAADKAAKDAKAKDAEMEKEKEARDAEMADVIKKPAMDAAIAAATTATEKRVVERQREIRKAESAVRPYVGELSADLAFDSADDVYRHALTMLGVKEAKEIHASALPTILGLQPKPGAKPVQQPERLGADAAAVKRINERFPGLEHIGTA